MAAGSGGGGGSAAFFFPLPAVPFVLAGGGLLFVLGAGVGAGGAGPEGGGFWVRAPADCV